MIAKFLAKAARSSRATTRRAGQHDPIPRPTTVGEPSRIPTGEPARPRQASGHGQGSGRALPQAGSTRRLSTSTGHCTLRPSQPEPPRRPEGRAPPWPRPGAGAPRKRIRAILKRAGPRELLKFRSVRG